MKHTLQVSQVMRNLHSVSIIAKRKSKQQVLNKTCCYFIAVKYFTKLKGEKLIFEKI